MTAPLLEIDHLYTGYNDVLVAGLDGLGRKHDSLESGAANLVDSERGNRTRNARLEHRLASRSLTGASLHYMSHDHFLDLVGRDICATERLANYNRPKLGRRD